LQQRACLRNMGGRRYIQPAQLRDIMDTPLGQFQHQWR
jgi:hypothetical protein